MSSAYTPAPEYAGTDATVLADGDAANATNLNTAPKKALDRAAYLRAATDGLLVWGGNARVDSGGTNNGNFKVYVPPIEAVSLYDGAAWQAVALATETELTSATAFSSGTLANSTPYYVYATLTAGVLTFEVSTTAPAAGNIWKSGATGTHRYLFSFFTNGSGVAIPMRRTLGGRYAYRVSAISTTALQALFGGNGTTWADLALGSYGLPANARVAILEVVLNNVTYDVELRTKGDSGAYRIVQSLRAEITLETDSAQKVQYQVSSASASADVNLLGYEE